MCLLYILQNMFIVSSRRFINTDSSVKIVSDFFNRWILSDRLTEVQHFENPYPWLFQIKSNALFTIFHGKNEKLINSKAFIFVQHWCVYITFCIIPKISLAGLGFATFCSSLFTGRERFLEVCQVITDISHILHMYSTCLPASYIEEA